MEGRSLEIFLKSVRKYKVVFKKYKRKIKEHFKEVLEVKTSPNEIALGFSVGTFFANIPTLGFEFLIIILILILFKRVSKLSLILAYAVFNPLITYPLSAISYLIGDGILGEVPVTTIKLTLFEEAIRFTIRYLLGSLIVATALAITSYLVVYYFSRKYQKKEIPILQKPIEINI